MEGNVHQLPVDHPPWAAGGAAGCLMVGEGYHGLPPASSRSRLLWGKSGDHESD